MGKCHHTEHTVAKSEFRQLLTKSLAALAVGVPLFVVSMLGKTHVSSGWDQFVWFLIGLLVLAVMWYSGRHYFLAAWTSFKAHTANMNTLVALATGPAWIYSMLVAIWPGLLPELARNVFFDAPMTVIGLLMLGAALELRAGEKSSVGVTKLKKLIPETASLLKNDTEETQTIALHDISVGQKLSVGTQDIIPVDGTLLSEQATINVSTLTGELRQQTLKKGDKLYAGMQNVGNALHIEVSKQYHATHLQQIIDLLKQAQNTEPSISAIADKIAAIFAPTVLIVAILTATIWLNFGPQPVIAYMLVTFMAVLLIACPCALGLAAPVSSSMGIAKAAQSGIIFRNSNALSDFGRLDAVCLMGVFPDLMQATEALRATGLPVILFADKKDLPADFSAQPFEYVSLDNKQQDNLQKIRELQKAHPHIGIFTTEQLNADDAVVITSGMDSHQHDWADICILRKSLFGLFETYLIAKNTLRNIKQNLWGAFLYNIIGIPIAAGILYPVVGTLLNPILAGTLMACSSLVVILNANRLQWLNTKTRIPQ